MGFWIFMLVTALLIPLALIGVGAFYAKGGPRGINGISGYRTYMSMRNMDTWAFAHRLCGRLWRVVGLVMLPLSVCAMFLVLGREVSAVGWFTGALVCVQTVFMTVPLVFVERALSRNFDRNGNYVG